MWGPNKYQEETPELLAAIQELQARIKKLTIGSNGDWVTGTCGKLIADGIVVIMTWKVNNDIFRILDGGFYVEVCGRRAYTQTPSGESIYADPDLIIGQALPALRQLMVLDDIVDATKESPSEREDHPDRDGAR